MEGENAQCGSEFGQSYSGVTQTARECKGNEGRRSADGGEDK